MSKFKNDEFVKIVEEIKESVKPAYDAWQEDFYNFVKKVKEYCLVGVYEDLKEKGLKRDAYNIYALKCENGYSKSLERFFGRSDSDLREMIKKEANHKLLKIDVAVAKKLKNVKVEKVEKLFFNMNGKDVFCEGSWKINDEKIFSFHTIYAGGYNIQCEHVRTLYKYK